jgi:hypothetical protein
MVRTAASVAGTGESVVMKHFLQMTEFSAEAGDPKMCDLRGE